MKKALIGSIAVLFLVGLFAPLAMADDALVKFKGGIGVDPVSRITGFPSEAATGEADRNDVRGVKPGGQPWVISKFKANVEKDGEIKVNGKGLLLAGGEGIGTTGGLSVFATLFCDDPSDMFTSHSSGTVTLESDGDFKIKDTLDPVPPDPCDNPVLLIRVAGPGRWIAAGIPRN